MSLIQSINTSHTSVSTKSAEHLQSVSTLDEECFEEEEELDEEAPVSHKIIWKEIIEKSENDRKELDTYILSKIQDCDIPENPPVAFLEKEVFPLLLYVLEQTIKKAKAMECIKHQKSTFNGIDYMAEMLWNLNPKHPERGDSWVYRFDMDWVKAWLHENPRPYFPFSWVWSKDFAATKIQAAMRGHWVRITDDVQELRQFWKALQREKREAEFQNNNSTTEQEHI